VCAAPAKFTFTTAFEATHAEEPRHDRRCDRSRELLGIFNRRPTASSSAGAPQGVHRLDERGRSAAATSVMLRTGSAQHGTRSPSGRPPFLFFIRTARAARSSSLAGSTTHGNRPRSGRTRRESPPPAYTLRLPPHTPRSAMDCPACKNPCARRTSAIHRRHLLRRLRGSGSTPTSSTRECPRRRSLHRVWQYRSA